MNLEHLNNKQKEAVLCEDGPLLILAGAGSGKTSVLTTKIAYLIKEKGINKKIMVLSSKEVPKKNQNKLGSNAFVPSSAGLLISSYIINEFIK